MSARFDVSAILAPASTKPKTQGPRDGSLVPKVSITHICADDPETKNTTAKKLMITKPVKLGLNGRAVVDLLKKNGPLTTAGIGGVLGANCARNGLHEAKKKGVIKKLDDVWHLTTGDQPLATTADGPFAAALKKLEPKPTDKPSTPTAIKSIPKTERNKMIRGVSPVVAYDDEPRALQLRSGDVIVFSGNCIIAELNRAEYQAVLALDYQ